MATARNKIPVVLLTGFLGSGKTTLLNHMLHQPGFEDTAVLVNEFGSIGLDHRLLWGVGEVALSLENGCICCTLADDFLSVMKELFWKRLYREISYFPRIVIETTGLADTGNLLTAIAADKLLMERFQISSVLCAVDSILGAGQLEEHSENAVQIASADTLVLTKTDLATEDVVSDLEARIREINPAAQVVRSSLENIPLAIWENPDRPDLTGAEWRLRAERAAQHRTDMEHHDHHHDIQSFTIELGADTDRAALSAALDQLIANAGGRVLRAKGVVRLKDESVPILVQVVGPIVSPFEPLAHWPEGEPATGLIFITRHLSRDQVESWLKVPVVG